MPRENTKQQVENEGTTVDEGVCIDKQWRFHMVLRDFDFQFDSRAVSLSKPRNRCKLSIIDTHGLLSNSLSSTDLTHFHHTKT